MKDNRLKGIIALAVVTVISFAIIYGSKILTKDETTDNGSNTANNGNEQDLPGSIDVSGAEGIVSARELTDNSGNLTGYSVVSQAKGFGAQPVTMEIVFDTDAKTIQEVKVVSHSETPGYGGKLEEESFLNQFKGIKAPIYLKGKAPAADNGSEETAQNTEENTSNTSTSLKDGIYRVQADEFDQGYLNMLTLKVEGGKITSVVFDAMNEEGEYKSYLSSVGEYVMTEDGLTWKEQADALANYVIEHQSAEGLTVDENGKTDVVAGVSINIKGFLDLLEKALKKAAAGEGAEGTETADNNTPASSDEGYGEIDAVSGATFTTNAILELVNNAYEFIQNYTAK